MAESVVTDELRALIDLDGPAQTLEVTSTGCRLFARAVGHTDLIFYDEQAAQERGYRAIVAPPGFLGTPVYIPGQPRGDDPMGLNIPYKRLLNGGTTFEYFEPVCAGDVLTSRTRITEFQEREGSIGPMLITYRETAYARGDGVVVAKTYGNMINY
jgi:acyl dehydratase